MPLLDGLTLPEWILLVAGCVLFLVLVVMLLQASLHNKSYKALLPFFALPVVMIGFYAIQSIEIGQYTITLANETASLQNNPNDAAVRSSLKSTLEKIGSRPFTNPDTLTKIAAAHFALGNESAAKEALAKALKADPTQPSALQLQRRINVATKLTSLAQAAEKQPSNAEVKQQLQSTVEEAKQYKFANPAAVQAMQKATRMVHEDVSAEKR